MTNEEALRLAKLAWPERGDDVHVVSSPGGNWVDTYLDAPEATGLLFHRDRARFAAALRVLAGEPCAVTCSTCGAPWAIGQSHTCGAKP